MNREGAPHLCKTTFNYYVAAWRHWQGLEIIARMRMLVDIGSDVRTANLRDQFVPGIIC